VLVAPLLIVDVPPLVDYPNHLARAFVLASLPSDQVLAKFYSAHWAIIPNLATDLIGPPLLRLLPVHVVGRLLIAAAVLLPVLGIVAYSTALGSRWWCLGAGLVAYPGTLMEGFINFSFSVGLALLLAAGWLRWREIYPVRTMVLAACGAVALFVCHLMGLLFFAVLLACAEFCHVARERPLFEWSANRRTFLHNAVARVAVLLLIFATPCGLYAASALQTLGGDAGYLSPAGKLIQLLIPFTNFSLVLDVLTAATVVGVPCVCLVRRKGRMPGPAALAVCILLAAYLAAPFAWKGTYALDTRFAVMLGCMPFAGFVPTRWPVWLRSAAVTAVSLLLIARMALLTTAWIEHRSDLAALRQALAPVLPGQAVYVASVSPAEAPAYWAQAPWSRRLSDGTRTDPHLGALALIERRAWWPFQFDIPSQQPLETRPEYQVLAARVGSLPDRTGLLAADLCGFDVVLLLQADAAPILPATRFHPLARAGFAALYSIADCHPPG